MNSQILLLPISLPGFEIPTLQTVKIYRKVRDDSTPESCSVMKCKKAMESDEKTSESTSLICDLTWSGAIFCTRSREVNLRENLLDYEVKVEIDVIS